MNTSMKVDINFLGGKQRSSLTSNSDTSSHLTWQSITIITTFQPITMHRCSLLSSS